MGLEFKYPVSDQLYEQASFTPYSLIFFFVFLVDPFSKLRCLKVS
jgi:hypothetical protein